MQIGRTTICCRRYIRVINQFWLWHVYGKDDARIFITFILRVPLLRRSIIITTLAGTFSFPACTLLTKTATTTRSPYGIPVLAFWPDAYNDYRI